MFTQDRPTASKASKTPRRCRNGGWRLSIRSLVSVQSRPRGETIKSRSWSLLLAVHWFLPASLSVQPLSLPLVFILCNKTSSTTSLCQPSLLLFSHSPFVFLCSGLLYTSASFSSSSWTKGTLCTPISVTSSPLHCSC